MRAGRLASQLLAVFLCLHGSPVLVAGQAGLAPLPVLGGDQQSVPLPAHDEATCVFCQAAVSVPSLAVAQAVIPEAPALVLRGHLSPDERLPHRELPTGPLVVCAFGLLLLVAYFLRRVLGQRVTAVLEPAPEGW